MNRNEVGGSRKTQNATSGHGMLGTAVNLHLGRFRFGRLLIVFLGKLEGVVRRLAFDVPQNCHPL